MPEEAKNNAIKAGAAGVTSSIMPYAALGILAYAGYKYLESKEDDIFEGAAGIAGGISERIESYIENTKTVIKETTKDVSDIYYYGGKEDESVFSDNGSYKGKKIPGGTKYITKTASPTNKYGWVGNFNVDERSARGLGLKETSQMKPKLTNDNGEYLKIKKSDYNKNLIDEQISKYGNPLSSTKSRGTGSAVVIKAGKKPRGKTITQVSTRKAKIRDL
jgi:hypothetical protein